VFGELRKNMEAFYGSFAKGFGHQDMFANAARSVRNFFSEERYDWASKLQPPDVLNSQFRLNSGMPQMKGVSERPFNMSSHVTPGPPVTVFDRLMWTFEDLGKAIKDARPQFEAVGKELGKLASIDFDILVESFKSLAAAAQALSSPFVAIAGLIGPISNTITGGYKNLVRSTEENYMEAARKKLHLGKDVDFCREADEKHLEGIARDIYFSHRSEGLSVEGSMEQLKVLKKNITGHATGGIVRKPHLGLVGEAGPEAIIPLRKSKRSLGLLDAAAGAMGVGTAPSPTIHKTINIKPTINITGVDSGTAQRVAGDILSLIKEAAEDDYSMATT